MNFKEQMAKMNYVGRYLKHGELKHMNAIRLNANRHHDKHNRAIIERCLEYLYLGIPFITEAKFGNGQRCDILLPMTQEIEEIMITETQERLEAKEYPFKIKVVRIK